MSTLYIGLTILLVFVSIAIIALVLLQKGKGADAGAAFGAGASGTVFGARGSTNFLSRATAILAAIFFVNCLALAYLGSQRSVPESLLDDLDSPGEEAGLIPAADSDPLDLPEIDDRSDDAGLGDADLPELPESAADDAASGDGETSE